MAITRTKIYAALVADVVYKDNGGNIKTEEITITVPGCDSRMKAEIALEKRYPKTITNIKTIKFVEQKRRMEEPTFEEHSVVVAEKEITEDELKEREEKRKRKAIER